jgi:hypothetical protein
VRFDQFVGQRAGDRCVAPARADNGEQASLLELLHLLMNRQQYSDCCSRLDETAPPEMRMI